MGLVAAPLDGTALNNQFMLLYTNSFPIKLCIHPFYSYFHKVSLRVIFVKIYTLSIFHITYMLFIL